MQACDYKAIGLLIHPMVAPQKCLNKQLGCGSVGRCMRTLASARSWAAPGESPADCEARRKPLELCCAVPRLQGQRPRPPDLCGPCSSLAGVQRRVHRRPGGPSQQGQRERRLPGRRWTCRTSGQSAALCAQEAGCRAARFVWGEGPGWAEPLLAASVPRQPASLKRERKRVVTHSLSHKEQ